MPAMKGASRWLDACAGLIPMSALAALTATRAVLNRMCGICLSGVISELNKCTYGGHGRLDAGRLKIYLRMHPKRGGLRILGTERALIRRQPSAQGFMD